VTAENRPAERGELSERMRSGFAGIAGPVVGAFVYGDHCRQSQSGTADTGEALCYRLESRASSRTNCVTSLTTISRPK
jgi:hypothetical protein